MTSSQILLLFYVVAFIAIYYFLIVRPQQRRANERRMLIESLRVNDEVLTIGGLYGKVKDIREDIVTLQVAENVRVKVDIGAISERLVKEKARTSQKGRNNQSKG
ncbi:MAG: preprotein translocase subunit YajC [Actinobacteria bacterium]|nr:preprotein translocase subunit YajC [Actinomycetota bacterium]